jgi:hypothetical protein
MREVALAVRPDTSATQICETNGLVLVSRSIYIAPLEHARLSTRPFGLFQTAENHLDHLLEMALRKNF